MTLTVYGSANCVQCQTTYKVLDKRGIAYEKVDVNETPGARQAMQELGHRQLPVVVAGERHWSGFQPDMINSL